MQGGERTGLITDSGGGEAAKMVQASVESRRGRLSLQRQPVHTSVHICF